MTDLSVSAAAPRRPATGRRRRRRRALAVTTVAALAGAAGLAWWHGTWVGVPIRERCTASASDRTTSLDPEQAGNAATITTVAVSRGLPARAATIGIATAMQESKLRNIAYGDRDSRGLFQQRPSQGWGTAEEVTDPVYAANAFYDVLIKVEGYQTAAITDAAQQVQRSAFPSAYAQHEPEARVLASALSGYSEAALTCDLRPVAEAPAQVPGVDGYIARARAVVDAARRETGREASGPGDEAGTTIRYTVSGGDASRLSWSLAHWAVARADLLDVVAVRTDGRQWRREAPGEGWTDVDSRVAPKHTVQIVVSGGDA